MTDPIDRISSAMIKRYSKRYMELGRHVKTLGWGNSEQQEYRFRQAIVEVDFGNGKSVLDIGCGFGDLLALLIAERKPVTRYTGWDINPDLIAESNKLWTNSAVSSEFTVVNIGKQKQLGVTADIGFMFGLLNLNLKGEYDNYEYSKAFIVNAFSTVNELLVVDFLSDTLSPEYPKEDFVFYHSPAVMLEFALALTPNVVLKHNYAPIPQKEFMLFLHKS